MSGDMYVEARDEAIVCYIKHEQKGQDASEASLKDIRMKAERLIEVQREAIECIASFQHAIHEAGGALFDYETLKSMTLIDFMTKVAAQNNIRFYFQQPKDQL